MNGTTLAMSSIYHAQIDGQTKIVNKCLEGYLGYYSPDKQHQRVKWIPLSKWWYNTTYHTSTKISPFEALYG
jgi:hypothetical protein